MNITKVTSNEDLENLLNRILLRVTKLEEQVSLLDQEVAGIGESLFAPPTELDS